MRIRSAIEALSSLLCKPIFAASLLCSAANAQQPLPNAPSPQKPKIQTTGAPESGWPRTFTSGADTFTIYQPQVDKWDENLISLYGVVELKAGKESATK